MALYVSICAITEVINNHLINVTYTTPSPPIVLLIDSRHYITCPYIDYTLHYTFKKNVIPYSSILLYHTIPGRIAVLCGYLVCTICFGKSRITSVQCAVIYFAKFTPIWRHTHTHTHKFWHVVSIFDLGVGDVNDAMMDSIISRLFTVNYSVRTPNYSVRTPKQIIVISNK